MHCTQRLYNTNIACRHDVTSSLLLDTPEVLAPMSSVLRRDMETLIIPGDRCLEPGVAGAPDTARGITMVGTRSVRRLWAVRPGES